MDQEGDLEYTRLRVIQLMTTIWELYKKVKKVQVFIHEFHFNSKKVHQHPNRMGGP